MVPRQCTNTACTAKNIRSKGHSAQNTQSVGLTRLAHLTLARMRSLTVSGQPEDSDGRKDIPISLTLCIRRSACTRLATVAADGALDSRHGTVCLGSTRGSLLVLAVGMRVGSTACGIGTTTRLHLGSSTESRKVRVMADDGGRGRKRMMAMMLIMYEGHCLRLQVIIISGARHPRVPHVMIGNYFPERSTSCLIWHSILIFPEKTYIL